MEPKQFGNYEVLEEIANNGTTAIYRARHKEHGWERAIKTSKDRQKLEQEVTLLEKLSHENIVRLYDSDTFAEEPYLAITLAKTTLEQELKQGKIPYDDAIKITQEILAGLEHAHQQGVIHCDLKPQNILLGNRTLICDFDYSKTKEEPLRNSHTTTIAGTIGFMAPEYQKGLVSEKTDVFSAGVVLYQMLTGKTPCIGECPKPSETGSPNWMDTLYFKAVQSDPDKRFSVAEMQKFIEQNTKPEHERRIELYQSMLAKRETWKTRAVKAAAIIGFVAGTAFGNFAYDRITDFFDKNQAYASEDKNQLFVESQK